ncbi:MAG: hypothetical protein IJU93_03355 [Lachnospiraceae bacterium]|nr:hypothetical protein [Lachnospiraceae bacterium]
MAVFIIIAIVVILLFLRGVSENARNREKRKEALKKSFGAFSSRAYGYDEFERIRSGLKYLRAKENEFEIDDITANDINLDELYKSINISCSQMGDEYLYRLLRRPVSSEEVLKERGRVAELLDENEEFRLELMERLKNMGRISGQGLWSTLEKLDNVRCESNALHYFCLAAALIAAVLIFVRPVIGFVAVLAVLFFNVFTYFKRKGEIDGELVTFAYIFNCLYQAKYLIKIKAEKGLEKYFDTISAAVNSFKKVTSSSYIIFGGRSLTGSFLSLFVDYIRIVFHLDLIKFNSSLKFVLENRTVLFELLETMGFLDAALSIASFRRAVGIWCTPVFKDEDTLDIKGLHHPLIKDAVPYDICTDRGVLVTGSNASGKSTFLRSVALGVLLGETIYTVPAAEAGFAYSRIYSSMAASDSITGGDSLYMAEIKAVKRIVDALNDSSYGNGNGRIICFLDELLRGTNTIERIAAGSGILKELAGGGALCFAATHDIELTDILSERFDNYHFSESIENDSIRFNYRLEKGAARTRNAIALLKLLGFDEKITAAAFEEAGKFENTRTWSRI